MVGGDLNVLDGDLNGGEMFVGEFRVVAQWEYRHIEVHMFNLGVQIFALPTLFLK